MADAPNAASVEIDGATKVYRRRRSSVHALDHSDLSIPSGDFVSLIGPSGCGKSTLLKMIAGLLEPTTGEIRIDGSVADEPTEGVAVAFQKPTLLPWRTVLQNVSLPLNVARNVPSAEIRERGRELLAMMGLEEFEKQYPRELSGGMEQRVAIARSLITRPTLLLMDEPFGALDEFTREDLNDELLHLWQREPKTVVFVTHSIAEAVFLSDRIVVMSARPGRIHEIVHVDLPRPRAANTRDTAEFYDVVRRVRTSLESVKSSSSPVAQAVGM